MHYIDVYLEDYFFYLWGTVLRHIHMPNFLKQVLELNKV